MTLSGKSTEQRKIRREITAGFIVFRRTQEGVKFLILYHRGSYWNFPKGHIESEENSLNAAMRETKEETGLGAQDLRIMPGFKAYERFYFRKQNQPVFKIVIFYLAETKNRNVKISEEHHGYAWFLYNDAKKILGKYQDSQRVLKQANDFIHHKHGLTRTGHRPTPVRTHQPTPSPHRNYNARPQSAQG